MSSTLLLPPRAQLCNRSCSNKTHTPQWIRQPEAAWARGPKRKVGRSPRRACCRRQNIQPGSAHTSLEPFSRALLGQRARRRLHHAGLVAGSRMPCAVPGRPGRLRGGSQVTGPHRPASARRGPRPGSPRPPQSPHQAAQASPLRGWVRCRGLEFAGAQDSI